MLVVAICSWPSQSAITVVSTPAWRSRIAAVCRSVWAVTCLLASEGQAARGFSSLGKVDAPFNCVSAQRAARAGCEERCGRRAIAFLKPCPHEADGGGQQRGAAFFAAFAHAVNVRSDAEVDVGHGQSDQLADAEAGLDGQSEHGMVAAAGPGALVAGGQQGVGFMVEEADQIALDPCSGDRQNALDDRSVFGMPQRGVGEQRVDCREPGVAGPRCCPGPAEDGSGTR